MGRGRGLLDELAAAPWPVGVVAGLAGFALIRHGLPAWFSDRPGVLAQVFAQGNPLAALAWIVLGACWLAAFGSWLGARRRRRLLDTRTGLDSIAALGWRDFERLVGEAFRRDGYRIEETGLGGADGGIDLVLTRDGRRILVQCKRWQRSKVPVGVVREMYGLLAHHRADEVRIATLGGYTRSAARFAEGKPIVLIDGDTLVAMVRDAQAPRRERGAPASVQDHVPVQDPAPLAASPTQIDTPIATRHESAPGFAPMDQQAPPCPRCRTPMVERENRWTGDLFWGCAAYPRCRGTR